LQKKSDPGASRGFDVFAGVFKGVLEKAGVKTWWLAGEFW
jgi:hypothetical protein